MQQINLYQAEFKPKVVILNSFQMLLIASAVLLLIIIASFFSSSQYDDQKTFFNVLIKFIKDVDKD